MKLDLKLKPLPKPIRANAIETKIVTLSVSPEKELEYTGDLEHDAKLEITEVATSFRARMKEEAARRKSATDSEYWCCLVFQSREQVEAFVQSTKWAKHDAKYIDGRIAARALGIALPPDGLPSKEPRIDKTWAGMII